MRVFYNKSQRFVKGGGTRSEGCVKIAQNVKFSGRLYRFCGIPAWHLYLSQQLIKEGEKNLHNSPVLMVNWGQVGTGFHLTFHFLFYKIESKKKEWCDNIPHLKRR